MVNTYKPPLVLIEKGNGEIHTYESIEDLVLQVEPIDIKHHIYEVYDATGIYIRLKVVKDSKMILGLIPLLSESVIAEVTGTRKADDLKRNILYFCNKRQVAIDTSSTEAMVRSLGAI